VRHQVRRRPAVLLHRADRPRHGRDPHAVGDEKITYLGYSYGTLLGAVYAQLFPKNIRALVLDGAVDPTQSSVASSEGQAKGFERAFTNFANWCKTATQECPIGGDARGAVTAAIQAARTAPATGTNGRKATAGWVFTAVISVAVQRDRWRTCRRDRQRAPRRPQDVFELADSYAERDPSGKYSNLFDANLAVNCADDDKSADRRGGPPPAGRVARQVPAVRRRAWR
jgi:pimeloyl-ACP methyl ester carboxylesterase